MNPEVEAGCHRVLQDLKADFEALKGYRIPPQFFGPAASQASKSFLDGTFDQFNYEDMNYTVDIPENAKSQGLFAREPVLVTKNFKVEKIKP